jgi:hypothetical protein
VESREQMFHGREPLLVCEEGGTSQYKHGQESYCLSRAVRPVGRWWFPWWVHVRGLIWPRPRRGR